MNVTGSFTKSCCLQFRAPQACLRCGQICGDKALIRLGLSLVAAELTTSVARLRCMELEACLRRMELEAAAFGGTASDIHAKVPGPVSAHPHASVKSAELRQPKIFTGEGSQD